MSEFIERSKDPAGCAAVDAHFASGAPRSTPGAKNVVGHDPYWDLQSPGTAHAPKDLLGDFDKGSGIGHKGAEGTGHKV